LFIPYHWCRVPVSGSTTLRPVLRIRDVLFRNPDPRSGSDHCSIPDPDPGSGEVKSTGSRIRPLLTNFVNLSRIPDPGSRIRIRPLLHPGSRIRIPDPGDKKAPDPGSAKLTETKVKIKKHNSYLCTMQRIVFALET
jgi:hypothetical protein